MPFSKEQFDNWFSYHSPGDNAPKYAAIRAAEQSAVTGITQALFEGARGPAIYAEVNRATRALAEAIDAHAPDSADKTAAIRCVRLARNCFNEFVTQYHLPERERAWADPQALFIQGEQELLKARFQANSAIACEGR